MGIKKIPEKIIKECDKCKRNFEQLNCRCDARITLYADGFDTKGRKLGYGISEFYIFCDDCYFDMKKDFLNLLRIKK